MRAVFITFQLCILGAAYLLVAIPAWTAVTGLAYALATSAEMVGAAVATVGAESAVHYSLQALGALSTGAAAPAAVAAVSSLAAAASTLFTIAAPLLATAAVNLVLGFASHYRGWHKKARRWAIVCNAVVLFGYAVLEALVLFAVFSQPAHEEIIEVKGEIIRLLLTAFMVWDSYFVISIILLCRMPRQPDAPLTVRRTRVMHIVLWAVLLLVWMGALAIAGTAVNTAEALRNGSTAIALVPGLLVNTATIVGSAVILAALLPFAVNAWAAGRIYSGRRKRFVLLMLFANIALTLMGLVLLPPVGVALALSAMGLYFVVEVTFLNGGGEATAQSQIRIPTS